MSDLTIKSILQKDIERKINGVVKADSNEKDTVITELNEYVVTEEIRERLTKFFDKYVDSINFPTEDMGVWISGFFGSGKSHFLKMIGHILENNTYDGKKVVDFFKDKIDDAILMGNIEKAAEIPTDVILFNIDNVSDQDTNQNKDSIAVAFLKKFNEYLGFTRDDIEIAEFERKLWEDGKLEEFKKVFEEESGKTWKDGNRNLDFYSDDFIDVVEKLEIMTRESAERWLERDIVRSINAESFRDILENYLKHRYTVITRRVQFELNKAEARAHILEGFRIALDNIDEVIRIIRASRDANIAREELMKSFGFTEIQARAILDMRLQRLTGLERDKIDQEYNELMLLITDLKAILADDARKYQIIREETMKLKEDFGDKRRTEIRKQRVEIGIEDLIKDEDVVVTLTEKGYVKRVATDTYHSQRRGGVGVNATNTVEDDVIKDMYIAKNLDTLLIFTTKGKVFSMKVYEIPESGKQARGKLIGNLIKLSNDEGVSTVIKVREFEENRKLFFITRDGKVKKTDLTLFANINKAGIRALTLNGEDELTYIGLTSGNHKNEIFIATRNGVAIRFSEEDVRSMGRTAAGVKGIDLRKDDIVVAAAIIDPAIGEEEFNKLSVLTVTEEGYGKRTKLGEYRVQSRGGKGIINLKMNEKTGKIVDVKIVDNETEVMLITSEGTLIRTRVNSISVIGRSTAGVRIMKVRNNEKVASTVKITSESELEEKQ